MSKTRLTQLKIEEISGVDNPANEAPGWAVAKAAEFKDAMEVFEKHIVDGSDFLDSEELDLFLKEAPDEVKEAATVLKSYVGEGLEEADEADADEPSEGLVAKLKEIFHKDAEEEPEAESTEEPEAESDLDVGDEETAEEPEAEVEESEEDEPAEEPEAEETAEEPEAEETEDEPEAEETAEEPEASEEAEESEAELIAKAVLEGVRAENEPIREALGAVFERLEVVEAHTAVRKGLDGQELEGDGVTGPTLGDAMRLAARGVKVNLS